MNMAEPALMRSEDGTDVPLVEVVGTARADGLLLHTTIRQRYVNRSGRNIEAVYTFPLPRSAVLLGLAFTLGDRHLAGRVAERKAAEQAYEDAIDDGDSAVLLERTGDGLYTVSVGNLRRPSPLLLRRASRPSWRARAPTPRRAPRAPRPASSAPTHRSWCRSTAISTATSSSSSTASPAGRWRRWRATATAGLHWRRSCRRSTAPTTHPSR